MDDVIANYETELAALRAELLDLKREHATLRDADLGNMRHLVERTRERDAALLQYREAIDALRIIKKEHEDGTIEVAFGLPVEIENAIRKADGLLPLTEKRVEEPPKPKPWTPYKDEGTEAV